MLRRALFASGFTLVILSLLVTPLFAAGSAFRYVVVFKNDRMPADAARTIEDAGGTLVAAFPSVGVGVAVSDKPGFAPLLENSESVDSAANVRFRPLPVGTSRPKGDILPTDAFFSYQWNIRRVKADKAWEITTGSHKTVVAVIDTGVAWNHPDLARNVVYAACFTSAGSCAWKTPAAACPCSPYPDLDPHGTAVAGIIAASSDGKGMVGVGPGLGVAGYNVFEWVDSVGPFAYDDSVWSAMFDAARRGYRVMNISLGDVVDKKDDKATITAWKRVVKEIIRQGVTIVASAGNDGLKLGGLTEHIPSDLPGVISVGATAIRPEPLFPQSGSFDVPAFYSNYGRPIDLVAPGGDCGVDGACPQDLALVPPNWFEYGVLSAFVCPGCSFTADSSPFVGITGFAWDPVCVAAASCQTDYTWSIGTSVAAPHVSAIAGLILERFPYLNPLFVSAILKSTAENLGNHSHFGNGMADAYRAVGGRDLRFDQPWAGR